MNNFEPEEEEDMNYVDEYDRKIRSFEWRVDADKASQAFLDDWSSPLNTVGTKLQDAMEKYRFALRQLQFEPHDSTGIGSHAYYARLCIEDALDRGIIIQGDGLTGKLENCEKERIKKENEFTMLSNKFIKLDEENKNLKDEVEMLRDKLYRNENKKP